MSNDNTGDESTDRLNGDRRAPESLLFGTARKAVASSVRALLSSDEGIRTLLGAVVPREAGQALLRELSELRNGVVTAIADELHRLVEHLDLAGEVQKVLDGLDLDIAVKVRISRRHEDSTRKSRKKTRSRGKRTNTSSRRMTEA